MLLENIAQLMKTMEAGSYTGAPGSLTQGSSLQIENLSPVMVNVCWGDEQIKLQRMIRTEETKSTNPQFTRQLSYGQFGGSAAFEGMVGQDETSDFARIQVPMCFYSHTRRVTIAANMVDTVDGKRAEQRAAEDAAKKIAADLEFDLFRGKADFSNAGVFDGNPATTPIIPNILGLDAQIRASDFQTNTQDLMFAEYGSDLTVVVPGGGVLTQYNIEDASVRSAMNHGNADKLIIDPLTLSAYNKLVLGKEMMLLPAGSAPNATGADLRTQWVSGGQVRLEASRFLSGKTRPQRARPNGPGAPSLVVGATAASTTAFKNGEKYTYFVTSGNERGESPWFGPVEVTVDGDGYEIQLTISNPVNGTARFFNVYRTKANAPARTAHFIGRVMASGSGTTVFVDLGNKLPGFVTGFLVQGDTMYAPELAPYSRMKLAQADLSIPEAHFRFVTLAVTEPRKNVLIDNLVGSLYTKQA